MDELNHVKRRGMIKAYKGILPKIHSTVFIEESAQIIGDVEIGEYSSVWFNAVVRGDVNYIRIGRGTNIQDGSLLHVTNKVYPLFIEDEVTIGHGVVLHGCRIRSRCLIGMGSVILDGADIEEFSIIAAGSVVTEKSVIPSGWLTVGVPAKPKRKLTRDESDKIIVYSKNYIGYMKDYM
jgi:carbonic anhydrase/acetyltransferase-like protein (isoleucine patch superfamily)